MLNTKTILFSALIFSSLSGFAFTPLDSIGVENLNGNKLIIHKVDPKESYYSIARRYKVEVKEIQTYNQNIALQVGTIVKIPTQIPFQSTNSAKESNEQQFEYKVVAKDNLNLIAERFATTVDEIKQLNKLTSNQLQIGQLLKIHFRKSGNTPTPTTTTTNNIRQTEKPKELQSDLTRIEVIEHTVKPKEYLNLIAKNYGVTADQIKTLNNLNSNNLQIGQTLKIPTTAKPTETQSNSQLSPEKETRPDVSGTKPLRAETPITKQSAETNSEPSFEHTVLSGETIYSIAHKYGLTTFQIKNLNNLTTNELSIGQKLKITGKKPAATAADVPTDSLDSETLASRNLKRPASAYGLNRVEERGTGVWINEEGLDASKMLVLHKSAAIGTIIQITNPMTNRSTFAKVVGKFTDNESNKDAIIVMTKAVADAIGALDKRFLCTLTYAVNDEKQ